MPQKNPKIVKEKDQCISKEFPVVWDELAEDQNLNSSLNLPKGHPSSPLEHLGHQNEPTKTRKMPNIKKKGLTGSFKEKYSGSEKNIRKGFSSSIDMHHSAIKPEPLDENVETVDKVPVASMVPLKYEQDSADSSCADVLDHILLSERSKLLSQKRRVPSFVIKGIECSSKVAPSDLDSQNIVQEAIKGLGCYRPRKRKKTAT